MSLWPWRFTADTLRAEVALGEGGLELDSVEIVELLLECERRSGRALTDALFTDDRLTIGRVATHFTLG